MNIGRRILELRKQKNITQEELAAELGVTAAAVSKWENSYTLPDIMMLCALADFFGITTDELLGRIVKKQYAVIVTENTGLGQKIRQLAGQFDIQSQGIYTNYEDAVAGICADGRITHLLAGHLGNRVPEIDFNMFACNDNARELGIYVSVSETESDILAELESCLK